MALKTIDKIIEQALKRKVLPEQFFDKLPAEARKFAFKIKGLENARVLRTLLKSLEKARANGDSFQVWKQSVDPSLFINNAHMRAVFTTHMNTQANTGKYIVAKEQEDKKPYLMYSAILDDVTRETHRAMHGIIRPVNDPFWNTYLPPNGYNCRCTVVPMSIPQADLRRRALRNQQNELLKEKGLPLLPASRSISTSEKEIKHLQKNLGARPDAGFGVSNKSDSTNSLDKYAEKVKKEIPSFARPDIIRELSDKAAEENLKRYLRENKELVSELKRLRDENERNKEGK